MDNIHSLLKRQLKKVFGDSFAVPGAWQGFLQLVNEAYREFDMDRNMLERSLDLSSQELLQTNSELRAIFETIPDLFFRLNRQGIILDCKAGKASDLFSPRKELIGNKIFNIPIKLVGVKFQQAINLVLMTKKPVTLEYAISQKEEEAFYEGRFLPLLEDQIVVVIRNVTEQKLAEKALKEREIKLERQNTVLSDLIKRDTFFKGDVDSAVKEITEVMAHTLEVERVTIWLFGEDPALLQRIDFFERSSGRHGRGGELRPEAFPEYFKFLQEERALMAPHARQDPRTREFLISSVRPIAVVSLLDAPIRIGGRLAGVLWNDHLGISREWSLEERNFVASIADFLALVIEASEHRQKEEQLRMTQFSIEHSDMAIFWSDLRGKVLHVNRAACDFLGYREEEIRKMDIIDWDPEYLPEKMMPYWKELRDKGKTMFSSRLKRNDGSFFPVEVNINYFEFSGKQYYFSLARDISERIQAEEERKKLQGQLIQAQKMEAVGTLAGGIAHDFNNLLMGIQGYASLMHYSLNPDHPFYEMILNIEDLVRSGADLTKQLLGFARGGKYEVKATDLNQIMEKTFTMFARTKKEIMIHSRYAPDLIPVDVDQGQMEQVFLNLYVNAWQAMPGGGEISVETQNVDLDEFFVKPHMVKPGKYARVSITDTGVGMDEKTKERIFEPFFTTKEMGRGTGLGLASVYGIIKNHGGIIEVYSEKGRGTTFTIFLPASERTVVVESTLRVSIQRGMETLLLVDDQEIIIKVGKELLEALGYQVLLARSGDQALDLYAQHRDSIALVILDMIMPAMSGAETYERLKALNPQVRVLLSSGYSVYDEGNKILDKGAEGFIQKPFDISKLSQKIRSILDRKGE